MPAKREDEFYTTTFNCSKEVDQGVSIIMGLGPTAGFPSVKNRTAVIELAILELAEQLKRKFKGEEIEFFTLDRY